MADNACIDAILKAVPSLSREEAKTIDDTIANFRKTRKAQGSTDPNGETSAFAKRLQEMAVASAMIEKRNTAMNILKADARLIYYATGGDRPSKHVEALLSGSQRTFYGAANSVDAIGTSIAARLQGGLIAKLRAANLLRWVNKAGVKDRQDLVNELARITDTAFGRETKNPEAAKAAQIIHEFQERALGMLNAEGAWIGKLPGWIVRQSHDSRRIALAGKGEWTAFIKQLLDEKTFAENLATPEEWLGEVWANLATGNHLTFENVQSAKDPAFNGPGNRAKKLSQDRVLHFKDADAWFAYNEKFGTSSIFEAALHGLDKAGKNTALMRVYGTNPEAAFKSDLDRLIVEHKSDLEEVGRLSGKSLQHTMDYLLGKGSSSGNPSLSHWGAIVRSLTNMASLGGVVLSSFPDLATRAAVLRYNGVGLLERWGSSFSGFGAGAEKREVGDLLGVGLDGTLGTVMSRFSATDNLPGTFAKIQSRYFQATLLNWWTDGMKRGVGFVLSRNLANAKGLRFGELHPFLRTNLLRYGIAEDHWNVLRRADTQAVGAENFLTAESLSALPADAFVPLLASRMADFEASLGPKVKDRAAKIDARRAKLIADERFNLDLALHTYYTDQANEAVTMPGAYERSFLGGATQTGTALGEAVRFLTQFKSFTTAFTTKQLGREFLRGATDQNGYKLGALRTVDGYGITSLIVGSTVLGYLSMTAKELAAGQTPSDPTKIATWGRALAQGGGLGIYGDFLLGQYNRFGGGLGETLGGPVVGKISGLLRLFSAIRDGDNLGGATWGALRSNIPFANLFYTRMALDYLILYQIQEALSPGSLRRMEQRIKKDSGRDFIFKRPSQAVAGGRLFEGVR